MGMKDFLAIHLKAILLEARWAVGIKKGWRFREVAQGLCLDGSRATRYRANYEGGGLGGLLVGNYLSGILADVGVFIA